MKKINTQKIKVLKAISQSFKNIMNSWKTLILFAVLSIAMTYLLEVILRKSGFDSFLGGQLLGVITLNIIKLLYIMVIIKTTSNVMKGESTQPVAVGKFSVSKIGYIFFQVIICSAVMVPPSIIVFILLVALTEAMTISTVIMYTMLGIMSIKIIFLVHGVVIRELDGLDSIFESISITKGNFIKLTLTLMGLWVFNYAGEFLLDLLDSRRYTFIILSYIKTPFMILIQVTLLTAMYHQLVFTDPVQSESQI